MVQRSYTVTVHPKDGEQTPADLARMLMPMVEQSESYLVSRLGQGPMILESDLTYDEAVFLKSRLDELGIPALVARAEAPIAAGPTGPPADKKQAEGTGWSSLFPGLEDEDAETSEANLLQGTAQRPVTSSKPPLDLNFGAENTPSVDDFQQAKASNGLRTLDASVATAQPSRPLRPMNLPPGKGLPKPLPRPTPKTSAPKATPSPDTSHGAPRPERFDGARLTDALAAKQEARPPFAPTGFDGRPDHITAVAILLSALAPGAGQVYNGQEDLALRHGLLFFLIVPWIRSVKQARARAEKIRTYFAPRPKEGTFLRALGYFVLWYAALGTAILIGGWTASTAYQIYNRGAVEAYTAQVEDVIRDARMHVTFGRVQALGALEEHYNEAANRRQGFTMSDEERAERLFAIGYQHCASKKYSMCEASMRRVTNLNRSYRDAYRLQAWASVQIRPNAPREPLPEVSQIRTLLEFEMDQFEKLEAEENPVVVSDEDEPEIEDIIDVDMEEL